MKTCGDYAPHTRGFLPSECCISCHDDANAGYSWLCEGTDAAGNEFEVCCALSDKARAAGVLGEGKVVK